MQIQKYIKPEYPTKLNDMEFSYSIGEMNKDYESEVILSQEIMKIAAKWLSLNIKSKSINTDEGLMVVVDHIMEECSNLELQEINFIFRSGISGKFGIIYNDISIDTICGKEGWIETYYKDFRKLRKADISNNYDNLSQTLNRLIESGAPKNIIDEYEKRLNNSVSTINSIKLTGNEITEKELYSKDENYSEFRETIQSAQLNKVNLDDAKKFLNANRFNFDNEYKKICLAYEKSGISEFYDKKDEYLSLHFSKLILKIRSDQIKLIDIYKNANKKKTTIDDAKQFYKIKQLTLDDLKEDMAYFSTLWQKSDKSINEKGFINECLRRFIIDNIYKTKQ